MTNPISNLSSNKPSWVNDKVDTLTDNEASDVENTEDGETTEETKTLPQLPSEASPTAMAVLTQLLNGTPPSPPRPTLPSEASPTAVAAVNKTKDDTDQTHTFPTLPAQASSTAVGVLNQLANGTKPPSPVTSDVNSTDVPVENNSNQPSLPPSIPDLPTQANLSARSRSRGLRHFGAYI